MLLATYVAAGTPEAMPYSDTMRGAFKQEYAWSGVDWPTAAQLPDAANIGWWGELDPDAGAWLILLKKPLHNDALEKDLDSPEVVGGSLSSLIKKYCADDEADKAWSSLTATFTELLSLGPLEMAYSTGVYPSFDAATLPHRVPEFLTKLSTPRNVFFPTRTVAMFWTTVRKMEALGAFVTEGGLIDADLPAEIREALDETGVSMVLDLPLNGEFNEFPISRTGVKYAQRPSDYTRIYREEMAPRRDGRDVPHPQFLRNKEGSAPDFFKFREVLDVRTHVASVNRSQFDIAVYEVTSNAGPTESLVNLALFDGLNAESLPSFHRYMSKGSDFYANKTFMLTPVLIGNFDYDGHVEVVEDGFLSSARPKENAAFYGTTSKYYGNGENTLDIHAMYSVMGNAHIYYAVSSPFVSPLMGYLMIYLLPHPTAPPPILSSSYGYKGHFGFSRTLSERLDAQFGLVRKLGVNLVLAAGDASLYTWEYANFPISRGSPTFGPSTSLSNAIQVGGYSPEAAEPSRYVPMGRFPTAPASNYQLFGTAGGVQVGSYELNANRRALCDQYLDWLTYNRLHTQATIMPSIFISNAGTGRCVPDVVGLGFTTAVQNGTAIGLVGGTSLAAPQTAAMWALHGHQQESVADGHHYRDLLYWLYAGRGGNLPKTHAYGGSIGTGFDQGWQASGGFTPYDLVYGLGRAHDRKLQGVSVAEMRRNGSLAHPPAAADSAVNKDNAVASSRRDPTYDEAIVAEDASTAVAAPTAAALNTSRPNATAGRPAGMHGSNVHAAVIVVDGGVVVVEGDGWGRGLAFTQFAIVTTAVLCVCCVRSWLYRRWRLAALHGFGPAPAAQEDRDAYDHNSYSPYVMEKGATPTCACSPCLTYTKEYEGLTFSSSARVNPFNRP